MKKIYILKVGTTFPVTKKNHGDFDQWTAVGLQYSGIEIEVTDVEHGEPFPELCDCAGAVITGSHSMVTERQPWSVASEQWLQTLLKEQIPIFGVCYGHQLLAQAAGGQVGYHPKGKEIGTVNIQSHPDCTNDPVFHHLPETFLGHTTHAQSVLQLPNEAVCLASNSHEPHHAFRIGKCAWGVQFHPEYNEPIMKSYIEEQADELNQLGMDIPQLSCEVKETPAAAQLLQNFSEYVVNR